MAPENRAARAMARTQFLALGLRYHSSDGRTEPRSESSQVVLVDELLPLMSHLRGAKSTALLGGPVGCTASALPVRIRMEQERSSQAVAISDKHPYHSSHVIVRRQRSQIVATDLAATGVRAHRNSVLATGAGMSQLKVAHCTSQAVLTAERPNFGKDRSIPCDAPESYNVRTRLRHRHRDDRTTDPHKLGGLKQQPFSCFTFPWPVSGRKRRPKNRVVATLVSAKCYRR